MSSCNVEIIGQRKAERGVVTLPRGVSSSGLNPSELTASEEHRGAAYPSACLS